MRKTQAQSRTKAQRRAAAQVIQKVKCQPESENPDFFNKQHIRSLKEHFDRIHVQVHGRTAGQVKSQYPNYPKSYSALDILRIEEPTVASGVEQKHHQFLENFSLFE